MISEWLLWPTRQPTHFTVEKNWDPEFSDLPKVPERNLGRGLVLSADTRLDFLSAFLMLKIIWNKRKEPPLPWNNLKGFLVISPFLYVLSIKVRSKLENNQNPITYKSPLRQGLVLVCFNEITLSSAEQNHDSTGLLTPYPGLLSSVSCSNTLKRKDWGLKNVLTISCP